MPALSEIQASSWEYREKLPSDGVSDNIPMVYLLKKQNRVTVLNGGREIWEDIRVAQNQYVQRIDPTEEITMGFNQTLTGFQYSPKIIVVPTVINYLEKAQNQGDGEFLNLVDQREQTAEDSLNNAVEEDLQGDGTGYGGKAFAGVRAYISTTPTSGSYGGITRASYSSIQNVATNAVSVYGSATDASNIESRLRKQSNLVVRQGKNPTFVLAGTDYFNAACDAMSAKQRITQDKDMVEAKFNHVVIEGMTMVLASGKSFSGLPRIAVDRCYGLDLGAFALRMYRGFNFEPVAPRISQNQLVDASILVGIGQFTSNGTGTSFVMFDS